MVNVITQFHFDLTGQEEFTRDDDITINNIITQTSHRFRAKSLAVGESMSEQLTCYTTQYLASRYDPKAHAASERRRTPWAPTAICSRTMTARQEVANVSVREEKGEFSGEINMCITSIWDKVFFYYLHWKIRTCSTHKLVVMIWFFKFCGRREGDSELNGFVVIDIVIDSEPV